MPFLRSARWDTRLAAAKAVGGIVDNTARYDPNEDDVDIKPEDGTDHPSRAASNGNSDDQLHLATLDLANILKYGTRLLGSAGKQYDYALATMDPADRLAYQKKSLNSRLGLAGEFFEEEILTEKDLPIPKANGSSTAFLPRIDTSHGGPDRKGSTHSPLPILSESPRHSFAAASDDKGLSKRQLNQLKRKSKADARNQAKKVRITDLAGPRRESEITTPSTGEPALMEVEVKRENGTGIKSEVFTLDRAGGDDDTKVVSEFKGAVVPARPDIQTDAEEEGLEWPFERLCDHLTVDLFDANWEVRHGAAMGLREVIRAHGKGAGRRRGKTRRENDALNQAWLDDLACRYCCVLMLDRFGDYISDNVVAPIRETIGQALGRLFYHMSEESLDLVYKVLRRMVMQTDLSLSHPIWEVCHGGMLGFKYLGAVRKDVVMSHLDGILEAVNKGLTDGDDDVRAVSAGTLIPIAEDFVQLRSQRLRPMVNVVWDCLSEIGDDLSASTGNIMDLLAKLCSFEAVIKAMMDNASADGGENPESMHSFQRLVPRLYPFLRHTIPSVRSAVLRALQMFIRVGAVDTKAWIDAKALRLIFQNIVVERYEDVLQLSFQVWESLVDYLSQEGKLLDHFQVYCTELLELALRPIGVSRHPIPLQYSLIMKPSGLLLAEPSFLGRKQSSPPVTEPPTKRRRKSEKKEEPAPQTHNVDGHMLQGDVDLVGLDVLIRSSIYSARAVGEALARIRGSEDQLPAHDQILTDLSSPFASTRVAAAMILEEQARRSIAERRDMASGVVDVLRSLVEGELPEAYSELVGFLQVARARCQNLLNVFRDQGKVPPSKIPSIPVIVQGDQQAGPSAFSIANAKSIIDHDFERIKKSMSSAQRLTSAQALTEARIDVVEAVEEAKKAKLARDVQIQAAASGALVALKEIPKRPGKVIKGLMESVKTEENVELQLRSCRSVASLLEYYASGATPSKGPAEKIVGNLIKFYCIDTSDTPEFVPNAELRDAILSLRKEEDHKDHQDTVKYEAEARAARNTRRGAKETLDRLSTTFGRDLFNHAPTIREKIEEPLKETFAEASTEAESMSPEDGQDSVDAFSILRLLIPTLHADLHHFVEEMLPFVLHALQSPYSVFRYAAAKCFATLCSVWTVKGMTILVEKVLPSIGNPLLLEYRQGAIETVYHLIHLMEDDILPYVVFLIVPILGRMSDSNSEVRLIATTTFATLVKLVPLEAGIPDPPGFSEKLLKGRDKERKFVAQMLDPKKTEPFEIPVAINAKLRSYQQDGVNWLAFLNRFNLHGVLCDDMGLGKTLQTICIVASDHHLRAEEYAKTQAPEVRRLPSLIVCPPTLSGHWQQEIRAFAPFLTTLAYVGLPADRHRLISELGNCDIAITSYDICRNDIDIFTPLNWNYCVLDEGHLIKNPRAKTSLAVKRINSNHRLILSGTPIQNNVLELWSLFDFLMPGFLGTEKVFQERFAKPIAASRNAKSSSKEQERGALAIESLHKQVLPFLLRRLKEEVLEDLPPKIVQNYYCDPSDLQKRLFEDFTKKEKKTLESKAGSADKESKQHIFQALQYMRKLCNSPALVVREGHHQYPAVQSLLKSKGSTLRDIEHAPKLGALRDLLLDCGIGAPAPTDGEIDATSYVSRHRALVFCQMKEMLDMVENDVLKRRLESVQYLRLDGSVEASRRQDIVNRFNTDPSYDVLLLTTSVGGLGLNLTGADTVIFVEHDWNPQKDLQAMDRAHRIGQKKVVNVYRLITRGTLEEKILRYVSHPHPALSRNSLATPADFAPQPPALQDRRGLDRGQPAERGPGHHGHGPDPRPVQRRRRARRRRRWRRRGGGPRGGERQGGGPGGRDGRGAREGQEGPARRPGRAVGHEPVRRGVQLGLVPGGHEGLRSDLGPLANSEAWVGRATGSSGLGLGLAEALTLVQHSETALVEHWGPWQVLSVRLLTDFYLLCYEHSRHSVLLYV